MGKAAYVQIELKKYICPQRCYKLFCMQIIYIYIYMVGFRDGGVGGSGGLDPSLLENSNCLNVHSKMISPPPVDIIRIPLEFFFPNYVLKSLKASLPSFPLTCDISFLRLIRFNIATCIILFCSCAQYTSNGSQIYYRE